MVGPTSNPPTTRRRLLNSYLKKCPKFYPPCLNLLLATALVRHEISRIGKYVVINCMTTLEEFHENLRRLGIRKDT